MIKVFTTGYGARYAGDNLTKMFEQWKTSFEPNTIEIQDISTSSNEYGWMLAVKYTVLN